ncbi:MAG TPA: ABC transporter ATP-binding protein [Balneolaceae bacterium]|nr:ABC transporter ATP-binding protein [Balneolaceae bacterium]
MISLQVLQLEKSFGNKTIFSDVSFDHQGQSLGIAGANGSGKSTFLKCLAYLLRPNKGHLEWWRDGEPMNKTVFKNKLGYAAPYINLYDELSCKENLAFLAKVRHEKKYEAEIDYWINKVALKEVADQPFGKLSTGQQQRLRLASALFHQPDILMLDEPGSNLDEAGIHIVAEIADSFKKPDKLLIIASNDREELNLCDQIFSIEKLAFAESS